jgi:hypothetical protein
MKNNILLKETIWLNFLRSFLAGITFIIISFFLPNYEAPIIYVVLWPFFMPLFLLILYAFSFVLNFIGLGGIGSMMCMLFTVPGDPLLFLLWKVKPGLVPIEELKIFNFSCIILLYNYNVPAKIKNIKNANDTKTKDCPYAGQVIADKEGSVLGFSWPSKTTIFKIDKNWNVFWKDSAQKFGWIDKNGQIREGIKDNPEAVLTPGKIIGKITFGKFYINGKYTGELIKS